MTVDARKAVIKTTARANLTIIPSFSNYLFVKQLV
jgi:hypothetical protein